MPSTLVLRNMVISDMKIPLDSWQTNNPAHPGQLTDADGWWGSNAKYPMWNKGMGGSICLGARMFARVIVAHVRFVANEIRTQVVPGAGSGTINRPRGSAIWVHPNYANPLATHYHVGSGTAPPADQKMKYTTTKALVIGK